MQKLLRIRTTRVEGGQWVSIREIALTGGNGKPITNKPRPAADGPSAVHFPDSPWRKLSLPHDWGIEGPFRLELEGSTGKLPWRGIGWYRKHFTIPAGDKGKQIFIDFDGAMAHAKVYCNGHYAGTWPYGYSSFRMDLTPHIKFGGDNVIAVRLDTENWDSRWYPGAGIYRHVWLVKTQPVHVGHWGSYLTTPEITPEKGSVKLELTLDNQGGDTTAVTVTTELLDAGAESGSLARVRSKGITIPALGSTTLTQHLEVPAPRLWSLENPHPYLARTTITAGDKTLDVYDTPFGFRTLKFTARDGFLLNGERMEIKGVCNHHDLGALGAALNERALERQLEILKEMGCNAIRTSHNPPAPELLDLCDRMGLLVWDEAFDCWARGKRANDYNKLYKEWHEKDLLALVRRDRNHPSVFIWSIGNEVMEQTNVKMTKHLADIMRKADPTRPVSNGYNNPNGGRASGAVQGLDIMGVNYFFNQQDKWDSDPRYKNMPTMGSETSSCVSSRGEYFFGTHRKNWHVSSYDVDHPGWGCTPDRQFQMNARWPHLLGEFVWTGFDYLGEPTPYLSGDNTQLLNFRKDPEKRAQLEKELAAMARNTPPSRSSYFGIIDLAGFPKDRYYIYQAHWRPELPMAHILPHWNWPERVGKVTPVHVYTSGDEAELFLNGKSQGRRKKTAGKDFRLVWDQVKYEPGELKLVAYKQGKPWTEKIVRTTGEASALAMKADRDTIRADGTDLSFVTVRITDKDGATVPRTHNPIQFSIEGPGEIVAVDNGDPTSFEPFQATRRKAFNGLALVIVKSKPGGKGAFTLRATSPDLTPASVVISGN
ncbi:MAG: glycoside hydrolase family 2 protein [Akkermansiaceae bacterium]|nr:glycoside hydrolase family 2 protein [Akkermansiaceae bacterium]